MKKAQAATIVILGSIACGGRVDLGSPSEALNEINSKGDGDSGTGSMPSSGSSMPSSGSGSMPSGSTGSGGTNSIPSGPEAGPDTPPTGAPWLAFDSNRDGPRGIYLIRSDGTGLVRLTSSSAIEIEPAFSADGTKLAFVSNATGHQQVHILDFATHVQTVLTHRPGGAHQPAWSRDGHLIAFTAIPEGFDGDAGYGTHPSPGGADLFVIRADGSGERSVVGAAAGGAFYPVYYPSNPAFGPDPNTIVHAGYESIHAVGVDGSGDREIAGCPTEGTETPSVSPDGTLVAFASWDINGQGIRTTSFTGHAPDPAHDGLTTLLAEGPTRQQANRNPSWGPTGVIAYETGLSDGPANLALVPASGGMHQPLTTGTFDDRNPAWAPIGFEASPPL